MSNKLSSAKKRELLNSFNWGDLLICDNADSHHPEMRLYYRSCQVWPQCDEDARLYSSKAEHQYFVRRLIEMFIKQEPLLFNDNILYNIEWIKNRDEERYLQNNWFRKRRPGGHTFCDITEEIFDEVLKRIEGEKDAESRTKKESENEKD